MRYVRDIGVCREEFIDIGAGWDDFSVYSGFGAGWEEFSMYSLAV